jgi:hypothetical protein
MKILNLVSDSYALVESLQSLTLLPASSEDVQLGPRYPRRNTKRSDAAEMAIKVTRKGSYKR